MLIDSTELLFRIDQAISDTDNKVLRAKNYERLIPMGRRDGLVVARVIIKDLERDLSLSENEGQYVDGWARLKNSLSEIELKTLFILLNDKNQDAKANVKKLADENDMMLEFLINNINEKAVDRVDDIILELKDTLTIYDEYLENVKKLVSDLDIDISQK